MGAGWEKQRVHLAFLPAASTIQDLLLALDELLTGAVRMLMQDDTLGMEDGKW